MKRLSASDNDAYWPAAKRPAMETRMETREPSSSYNFNMYGSGR